MDSPLSDPTVLISRLRHAVWHGDWNDAAQIAGNLANDITDLNPRALERRLALLTQTLDSARAGRSGMNTALARLRAVSEFSA